MPSWSSATLFRYLSRLTSLGALLLAALLMLHSYSGNLLIPIYCDRVNESLLASQHYNRVLKYAKCQTPYAHVVHINSQLHPSAIKKYIPHCTILHYCGPHSGCCRQENEQCVPKTIEEVKLYFWTIELTSRGHKKGIEVITMQNHTECMCAPINSSRPETTSMSVGSSADQSETHGATIAVSSTLTTLNSTATTSSRSVSGLTSITTTSSTREIL